ncbi:MAG: DUF2075 domain-containing protein [Gemmatimonadales bacterium]
MSAKYRANLQGLQSESIGSVMHRLAQGVAHQGFATLQTAQLSAWEEQLGALRAAATFMGENGVQIDRWSVLLEYSIPGVDRRVDAVLIYHNLVLVLEFKTGLGEGLASARRQVEDYALDLADFHGESAEATLIPIVVSMAVAEGMVRPYASAAQRVQPIRQTPPSDLGRLLKSIADGVDIQIGAPIDPARWDAAPFRPVPTILQAAATLFAQHEVREIADAGADVANLTATADVVVDAVKYAERHGKKVVCFITGVPGAGKTLAGLNAVHSPELRRREETSGLFLSGNGPLVKVLREALAKDMALRNGNAHGALTAARQQAESFVMGVHTFLGTYMAAERIGQAPIQRLIVFDEAQRAWNAEQRQSSGGPDESEPESILSVMDRHSDWGVVVCLIGGGQEIHDGEAGLEEWGRALRSRFTHWEVWASEAALHGGPGTGGHRLFAEESSAIGGVEIRPALHLAVSVRSYRSRDVATWVDALLSSNEEALAEVSSRASALPIFLTTSLPRAKEWLRSEARGSRRVGLVACSGAVRLRSVGIEVSTGFTRAYPYHHWFLGEPEDVRSSFALEVVATEFQCQGLELDSVGLVWGDDLTWDAGHSRWRLRKWSGKQWQSMHDPIAREYLINKYRVLLTRARTGMVIVIPPVDPHDATRDQSFLQETYDRLLSIGARPLAAS